MKHAAELDVYQLATEVFARLGSELKITELV
jgi:hypothetical protein